MTLFAQLILDGLSDTRRRAFGTGFASLQCSILDSSCILPTGRQKPVGDLFPEAAMTMDEEAIESRSKSQQRKPYCSICGSEELRPVSGGKMVCLGCGYIPSCSDGDCGLVRAPPPKGKS